MTDLSDSRRYFVLKGCAGIGNRLMTLSNVINYVQGTQRTLFVDWADGLYAPEGENPFYDYFRLVDVDHVRSTREIPSFEKLTKYPEIWEKFPNARLYDLYESRGLSPVMNVIVRFLPGRYRKLRNGYWRLLPQHKGFPKFELNASDYPTSLKQQVVFGGDYRPPFRPDLLLKHVAFRDEFLDRCNRIAKNLGIDSSTVGINIRATDIKPKRSLDRLNEIIEKIDNVHERRLFLATDNIELRAEYKRRYPNLVHFESFLHPDTNVGVHHWATLAGRSDLLRTILVEGLTELWLLSRCGTIVYQGESSFPLAARAWAAPNHKGIDWSQDD